MTTTHYVLIGLGAVLIAGLLLYNYLQERRFRKQADRMFTHRHGDVLLGDSDLHEGLHDGRIEPRIQAQPDDAGLGQAFGEVDTGLVQSLQSLPAEEALFPVEPGPPAAPASPQRQAESSISVAYGAPADLPGQEQAPDAAMATPPTVPPSPLDASVEYVARLRFAQPARLSFARLLDALRRLGKPVRAYGLRPDGVWEAMGPNPAAAYGIVELAMQLADRSGPASESLLDAFCRSLYEFATEHGGAVSCPERKSAVERALDLDQFCVEVDVLIGLNIVVREGHTLQGEDIHRLALQAGMKLGEEGAYVLQDAAGRYLFSLANQEANPFTAAGAGLSTHGISLLFDVPRVADGIRVFDRMTELGFLLADQLNARMVDDTGRAVTEDSLKKDRQRLIAFYARMEAKGIPAGGERALRLFR